jgi:hypothetical protein
MEAYKNIPTIWYDKLKEMMIAAKNQTRPLLPPF